VPGRGAVLRDGGGQGCRQGELAEHLDARAVVADVRLQGAGRPWRDA
jgi:hypothetical protein